MLKTFIRYKIIIFISVLLCSLLQSTLANASFGNKKFIESKTQDTLENINNHHKKFNHAEKKLQQVTYVADSLSKKGGKDALKDGLQKIRWSKYLLKEENINDRVLAEFYHVYGKLLVQNRKYDNGLDTLVLSLNLKRALYGDSDNKLAKTYNYLGIARFRKHDYEEALSNYFKVVEILTNNGYYGRDLFDVYNNIGIVKASLGSYDDALTYFKNASEIISADASFDSLAKARFYNNYGLLATFNGKVEDANNYFNISESYYIGLYGDNDVNLTNVILNMGVNSYYDLNYQLSLLYYNKVVDLYLSNDLTGVGLIIALYNSSVVNQELGNYVASVNLANKALSYNPGIDMKIVIYLQLNKTYELLGDDSKTNEVFSKVLNLVESPDINPKRKIDVYLSYADYLKDRNENAKAYRYYKIALDIEGELNGFKTKVYANILSKIGDYYLDSSEDFEMAILYFNRSIKIWQKFLEKDKKGNIDNSIHDINFSNAYRGKSKALIRKYELVGGVNNLYNSLDNYEWLLDQLERISRSLQKENQEIIRGEIFPIYNEVINLSYKLYNITSNKYFQKKSFEFAEKSKSAILLASIRNTKALQTSDISLPTLKLDQNLNAEINSVKQQLFEENQNAKKNRKMINFFDSRLLMLLKKHDSLVRQLEKNNPKYYSLKYDISVIDINELKNKLSSDEALVEYQIMDSSLYIFVLTEKELFTRRTNLDTSFYNSLDYILNLKNTNVTIEKRDDYNNFIKNSQNLYNILIEPIYNNIKGNSLLIIPSGILGYLPFEILINPYSKVNELDYRNLDYLIRDFPISYSYSSTLRFSTLFTRRSFKTKLDMLFMAPEYDNTKSDSSIKSLMNLKKLPFALTEVEDLYDEFGGKIYSGAEADKSRFMETAPSYDVLHLAMHTLINDSMPMYSKLVFSPMAGSNDNDIFLNTSEIYKMNLNASMVTLSACNTGRGVLQRGEGIMSLARGFVFAGVPSVVMTLWEVQDETGLKIMQLYYKFLSDGYKKDKAMQMAKIEVLNGSNMIKSHPNYWSAYIITGDTAELNIGNKKSDLWLLLLFSIPILFMLLFYKRVMSNVKY